MFGMAKPNAPDGLGLELSVLGTTLLAEPETGSSTPPAADDDAPLMKQYSTESGVVDDDPKIIQSEESGRSSIPEASFNLINSIVRLSIPSLVWEPFFCRSRENKSLHCILSLTACRTGLE